MPQGFAPGTGSPTVLCSYSLSPPPSLLGKFSNRLHQKSTSWRWAPEAASCPPLSTDALSPLICLPVAAPPSPAKTGRPRGQRLEPTRPPSWAEPPLVPDPRPEWPVFSLSFDWNLPSAVKIVSVPPILITKIPPHPALSTSPFLSLLVSMYQGAHHLELHGLLEAAAAPSGTRLPGFRRWTHLLCPQALPSLSPCPLGCRRLWGLSPALYRGRSSSGSGHGSGLSLTQSPRIHPPQQRHGLPATHHSPTPLCNSHRNGRGDPAGPTEQPWVPPAPTGGVPAVTVEPGAPQRMDVWSIRLRSAEERGPRANVGQPEARDSQQTRSSPFLSGRTAL